MVEAEQTLLPLPQQLVQTLVQTMGSMMMGKAGKEAERDRLRRGAAGARQGRSRIPLGCRIIRSIRLRIMALRGALREARAKFRRAT